jgi:hypothetical protein
VVSTLAATSPALAQSDDDRAGARAAASEGLKAYEAKRWGEALDLFTRAESLVHAPPHLLYMARANQQLGHLVKARELYLRIRSENVTPDKPRAFQEAQADAVKELAAIDPDIPYVKVVVTGAGGKAFTVTADGAPISSALVGVSRPFDPGPHKFQASGEGVRSEMATVVLKKGASETVTLDLKPAPEATLGGPPKPTPTLAPSPTPTAAPQPAPASTAPGAPPTVEQQPPNVPPENQAKGGGSPLRTFSYVSFGVAAVGVGAGILFEVLSAGKKSDADALCTLPSGACPLSQKAQVNSIDDEAKSDRTLAIVGFAVGGAALAGGVALFIAGGNAHTESGAPEPAHARRDTDTQPNLRPTLRPWVGLGAAGLAGTF